MFALLDVGTFPPRYNIAPTQPIVVVRAAASGRGRELVPMRWGLVPAWAKDPRNLPLLIMARADGIADKPAFKNAFRRRRCLIPADSFYEWKTVEVPEHLRRTAESAHRGEVWRGAGHSAARGTAAGHQAHGRA